MHICNKEKEITELVVKVKGIEKRLFGNGVKGLICRMDELLEYVAQEKMRRELKNGIESWSRRKILLITSIIAGVLYPVVSIILNYLLFKKFGG